MRTKTRKKPESSNREPSTGIPADEPKKSVLKEIADLYSIRVEDLRERHRILFGHAGRFAGRDVLIRAIAQKLQEDAFGALSEPAKGRLEELKKDLNPIAELGRKLTPAHRLPLPGTVLSKTYKGQLFEVKVLSKGFEYKGRPYRSLSRIAREISGVHQSGFVFFGL